MAEEDFYRVLTEVSAAKTYMDVFSPSAPDKNERLQEIKKAYRARVVHIHPDKTAAWHRPVASEAFNRLTDLYNQAVAAVTNDTFGHVSQTAVFATPAATHKLDSALSRWNDMADCYTAETTAGARAVASFVKIARVPADNELIGTEAGALAKLRGGDPKRAMYYPELIDTFGASIGGTKVRANALGYLDGFYNLDEVRAKRPDGLDLLDAAWMWRRLLWALDYAHDKGIIHGAVLPQNVMILPAQHGLVLVDWSYSVQRRAAAYPPLKAVVSARRDWYPLDVLNKKPASPKVDIMMAARTFAYVMGGDPATGELPATIPQKMRGYFKVLAARGAPDVATAALQYEDLLKQLGSPYYPRAFRPFVL